MLKKKFKTYAFDIDGVICDTVDGNYPKSKPNKNASSDRNAVAPKTSPVIPSNFCLDILPIKKTIITIKIVPNKKANKGK